MKKALKLALIYLIILILGTVLGTILYSFYLNLLGFIARRDITFFNDDELFKALFYVMSCMQIFVIPLISYYRIRHPGGVIQLIVYIVLCVLTWGILMPCTFKLRDFCDKKFHYETERKYLSPNFFRQVDGRVYFFTSEFETKESGREAEAPAVVIDTSEEGGVDYRSIGDYPGFVLNKKAFPFREIQVKRIFTADENPIPIDFKLIINKVSGSYLSGFRNFLLLFSFALLICSVYGLTNLFDWRLLNAVMIFIVTALALCVNSIYYSSQFDIIRYRLMDTGFFRSMNGFVSEPILFIVNCVFSLMFIVTGIVRFVVRKHAKKAR